MPDTEDDLSAAIARIGEDRERLHYKIIGLEAMNERLREEVFKRDEFLERNGFRRCDIPACNCGSWHALHPTEEDAPE